VKRLDWEDEGCTDIFGNLRRLGNGNTWDWGQRLSVCLQTAMVHIAVRLGFSGRMDSIRALLSVLEPA